MLRAPRSAIGALAVGAAAITIAAASAVPAAAADSAPGDETITLPINDSAAGGTYNQDFTRVYAGVTPDGTPVYIYVPEGTPHAEVHRPLPVLPQLVVHVTAAPCTHEKVSSGEPSQSSSAALHISAAPGLRLGLLSLQSPAATA